MSAHCEAAVCNFWRQFCSGAADFQLGKMASVNWVLLIDRSIDRWSLERLQEKFWRWKWQMLIDQRLFPKYLFKISQLQLWKELREMEQKEKDAKVNYIEIFRWRAFGKRMYENIDWNNQYYDDLSMFSELFNYPWHILTP